MVSFFAGCYCVLGCIQCCAKGHDKLYFSEWSYAAFVLTSVLIAIGFLISGKIHFDVSGKTIWLGAIAGMINGLGVLASFAAYRAEGKASAVTTIAGALQPVFTIVLALMFLNESLQGIELLGIVLAIGGALMLSHEKKKPQAVLIDELPVQTL